jgi:hypothetical protein
VPSPDIHRDDDVHKNTKLYKGACKDFDTLLLIYETPEPASDPFALEAFQVHVHLTTDIAAGNVCSICIL